MLRSILPRRPYFLARCARLPARALAVLVTSLSSAPAFAVSDATNSYCPAGYTLDSRYWLCVSNGTALGPFPPAMIDACIAEGGGESECRGTSWDADFARSLRGTGICPMGTTLDASVKECITGTDAHGPFSKGLVAHCERHSSDAQVCRTMRISRSFVDAYKRSGTNAPSLAVPYFYQYDNAYEPGRTCNLTSVAMVARYYGKGVTPDTLYGIMGGPVFTGEGMVEAARAIGLTGRVSYTASAQDIKAHLDAGRPVIVQGWFTVAGHIMVITGYDASGWIVNDPAGRWSGSYKGGYPYDSPTGGKGARYSYASMADAATEPGYPDQYLITVLGR